MYFEVDGEEWTGIPSHNPFYLWYWAKGNEKNREDPRTKEPSKKDIEHAKHLEMLEEAVKKHKENTGDENAKLTILRYKASGDMWWVSNHTVSV